MKQFVAVKAFINHKGKILIIREAPIYKGGTNIGKYDVIGGKIKPGEKYDQALLREAEEEVGISEITVGKPFYVSEWRPIINGEQMQIIGIYFECFSKNDRVKLLDVFDDYLWIYPRDYKKCKLIPNLVPAFEAYLNK